MVLIVALLVMPFKRFNNKDLICKLKIDENENNEVKEKIG